MGQKCWATEGHFPQGAGRGAVDKKLSQMDEDRGAWLKEQAGVCWPWCGHPKPRHHCG